MGGILNDFLPDAIKTSRFTYWPNTENGRGLVNVPPEKVLDKFEYH